MIRAMPIGVVFLYCRKGSVDMEKAVENGGFDNKEQFDEWVTNIAGEIFQTKRFEEMGKGDDFVFQALAFMGEGSHNLSLATTVLSELESIPDELKNELKSIQQQLHDFKEKLRNYEEM